MAVFVNLTEANLTGPMQVKHLIVTRRIFARGNNGDRINKKMVLFGVQIKMGMVVLRGKGGQMLKITITIIIENLFAQMGVVDNGSKY